MWRRFKKKIDKYLKGDVLIYQMGKVGSSSLESAIPNSIQIHDFYYTPPCYVHRKIAYGTFIKYWMHRLSLVVKRNLYRLRKEVKIITVIRDPFERNISMFFQSLPYWIIEYQTGVARGCGGVGARVESEEYLADCFNAVFPHLYPVEWFDKELIRYTGINVYSEKFNKDLGYQTYAKGKYKILMLDMNKISSLRDVVSEFVGFEVCIARGNDSTKKWYGELSKNFKKTYNYKCNSYYDDILKSKYFKTYYANKD